MPISWLLTALPTLIAPGGSRTYKAAMTDSDNGQVADAAKGNWVDTIAPPATRPYLRLSRADRPIGTWLLLIPCWWGLGLATLATGQFTLQHLWIAIGCAIGAWLMRGAGCTWNDITDRDFDAQVARTRSRPIPSGQVSVKGAVAWMVLQALLAVGILLSFPPLAISLGVASLALVAIYPFAKRFTWWPQVFLGLAFNWGVLLAWAAATSAIGPAPILLYGAGILWTLFYDTIYAHQDVEDDALIGVKSTARLFGEDTARWLRWFLVLSVLLFSAGIILALGASANPLQLAVALCFVWAFWLHMTWVFYRVDLEVASSLLGVFVSMWFAVLLGVLFVDVVDVVICRVCIGRCF